MSEWEKKQDSLADNRDWENKVSSISTISLGSNREGRSQLPVKQAFEFSRL